MAEFVHVYVFICKSAEENDAVIDFSNVYETAQVLHSVLRFILLQQFLNIDDFGETLNIQCPDKRGTMHTVLPYIL